MKYRFQIVASAFHKGRLKITYDPSYPITNEYNTNYTYIIDLAKERDFTVEIGWGHEKSMINHRIPGQDAIPYSDSPLGGDPGIFGNGIISVYVVNDLTVPNSTVNNDVEVNVFVSAGDDFEVFEPESRAMEDLVWFQPQVGETFAPQMAESTMGNSPDADLTKREDEPIKETPSQIMAPKLSDTDHTSSVYFGDPITSFRQCLKRYNYHSAISPRQPDLCTLMVRNSDFPYYRGYAPGAVHLTAGPVISAYNYSKMTLLNYLTPAFTCRRGAIRWKYFRTGGIPEDTSLMQLSRDASRTGTYDQEETEMVLQSGGSSNKRVRQAQIVIPHTWDGAVVTSTRHNPVIEAELPFYSNLRFTPAKYVNFTGQDGIFQQYHKLATIWAAGNAGSALIHSYISVGEDFQLGFFTGAPVAWRVPQETDPPAL